MPWPLPPPPPPHLPEARRMPQKWLLLLLCCLAALPPALACTSILVGANATTDGSWYLARTVDWDSHNFTNNLIYHPARTRQVLVASWTNNFTLLLPADGLAHWAAASPPPKGASQALPPPPLDVELADVERSASMEEVGVNSAGVVVSATETIFSSAAAIAADPLNTGWGLTEDILPSLLLPRATSAREGVQLLGQMIETIGSGEGYGVHFADAAEAWYLETAAGHQWLAQRIPDGSFFVSANQGRFQTVDLNDTQNVLASPGLLDFALENGLWDPDSGEPFNFAKAFHEDSAVDRPASFQRVRALQHLLGGFNYTGDDVYAPVFLPPGRPLTIADVMSGLRDHYAGVVEGGTPRDPYQEQTPAPMLFGNDTEEPWRPVAMLTTGLAHVTRMRAPSAMLPTGLSVINYLSFGTPAWTPFIPIYRGLPPAALPPATQGADVDVPDNSTLFWHSRQLSALIFQDWPALGPRVEEAVRQFDAGVEARRPAMEALYAEAVAAGDEEGAGRVLATYTEDVVEEALALLEELAEEAAAALGLDGLPPDTVLEDWLFNATAAYLFDWNYD